MVYGFEFAIVLTLDKAYICHVTCPKRGAALLYEVQTEIARYAFDLPDSFAPLPRVAQLGNRLKLHCFIFLQPLRPLSW